MSIIQYSEDGIFYDFIERKELRSKLSSRIEHGKSIFNSDPETIAAFLG